MKKKISIKDVANEAGVSPSAVSAVLNNKVGKGIRVGKENQDKIRKAADQLGYLPNPAAQNLVSGISNILSVFSYEAAFPFAAESEFYEFLLGIEKKAEKTGFDILLLTNKNRSDSTHETIDLNRLKLGDGGILIGIERHTEILLRLIDDGFPLVFIGRRDMDGREVNMVNFDYGSVIRQLVALSLEKGHRSCCYLRYNENQEPYADRQKALDSSYQLYGRDFCDKLLLNNGRLDGEAILQKLSAGITLFYLERKEIAIQLSDFCYEKGLSIGEDFSAVLLEDQWFRSDINWTSWSNERASLGMLAVELLQDIIAGRVESPCSRKIIPKIEKGSTLRNINL